MNDTSIPDDVRELLREHVWSHEHVELLLLLRSDPTREWTNEEMCANLRLPLILVPMALEHLTAHRLVEVTSKDPPRHRYSANPPHLDAAVGRLGEFYRDQPNAILVCLGANAIERVRTAAMRMFADSFLIRRKPDG